MQRRSKYKKNFKQIKAIFVYDIKIVSMPCNYHLFGLQKTLAFYFSGIFKFIYGGLSA